MAPFIDFGYSLRDKVRFNDRKKENVSYTGTISSMSNHMFGGSAFLTDVQKTTVYTVFGRQISITAAHNSLSVDQFNLR